MTQTQITRTDFKNTAKPLPTGHRPNIEITATALLPKQPPPPFKPNPAGLRQALMESIRVNGSAKAYAQMTPEQRALLTTLAPEPGTDAATQYAITTDPREDEKVKGQKPPSPLPYKETNQHFWKAALQNDNQTFADYEPHRIVVAWRILREMARRKKQVAMDQSLPEGIAQTAPENNPDPWVYPALLSRQARTTSFPYSHNRFIDLCLEAESLPPHDLVHDHTYNLPRGGFGYLPPEPAPCHYRPKPTPPPPAPPEPPKPTTALQAITVLTAPPASPPPPPPPELELDPNYDPGLDKQLNLYCRALQQVARDLHIIDGSPLEPDYGLQGMQGLADPRFVRLIFPTRTQICTFELLLTERCCNMIVQKNVPKARNALREEFGLTTIEVEQVMAMARRFAESLLDTNTKGNRAMIALRLEDYIQRSKDSLDLNNEIKGLKLLSIVQEVATTKEVTNVTTDIDIKVLSSKVSKFDFGALKAALTAPNEDMPQLPEGKD